MANLIFQALRFKKIESYLAMMPTISHASDFVFPSLSCANHMICVAHINSGSFLDATDEANVFELPSRHTQGRTVFCFSDMEPFRLEVRW